MSNTVKFKIQFMSSSGFKVFQLNNEIYTTHPQYIYPRMIDYKQAIQMPLDITL